MAEGESLLVYSLIGLIEEFLEWRFELVSYLTELESASLELEMRISLCIH